MMDGRVYLVGAGCGDPELITEKGQKLLQKCEAVLYDDLAAERLLEKTGQDCEKIFVGKRYGKHSMPQQEINALLVKKAQEGKLVVRLKGGDPFVFGRGGEEILTLQAEGIPYEIVSGVTSAIAVPAAAGIPVTHRKTARSFHVITGHTAADGETTLTENLEVLAKLEGTLVFLMGLHHLEEICQGLLDGGKNGKTPAAVISRGTTPLQKTVRGSLQDICEKVRAAELEAPAVIVIGETAAFDFTGTIPRPLYGVQIGVTGTKNITAKLRNRLEELGAAVTEMDYSTIVPYRENAVLEKELEQISEYPWAVFTSPNGVAVFFDYLKKLKFDIRKLAGIRFAVIGTGTAAALEKRGVYASLLPEKFDVESLAKTLCEAVKKEEKILILRAEQGSEILTEVLDDAGMTYTDVKIYDIHVDEEKRRFANEKAKEMDFITFASGSGVRGFLENGGSIPAGTKAVCIGTSTERMLKKYGDYAHLVAETFHVDGIVEAIRKETEK
ncbi:MAG: uroporphyrinogen-III C-methyltransferase [Bacillota bacterium]|nr:uroporphyrinogen-III C-methyltransferase [Bacillota bacterium]